MIAATLTHTTCVSSTRAATPQGQGQPHAQLSLPRARLHMGAPSLLQAPHRSVLQARLPTRRTPIVLAAAATEAPRAPPKHHEPSPDDVVIVGACRTPLTRAKKGGLKDAYVDDMVATVLKEVLKRTGVKAEEVGDMCFGSVLEASSKRANEVRMGMFLAGFPPEVPMWTVDRQCAAGLQAVIDVAASIREGYSKIGIAGGVEHMSSIEGGMAWAGSKNPKIEENEHAKGCQMSMGDTSEEVAARFNVSREEQDRVAAASHAKAAAARAAGQFKKEIVPLEVQWIDPTTNEPVTKVVEEDDGIRPDFTFEKLSKHKPCFKKGGTTTPGNASQTTDGAAAVLLMTRAEAEKRGLPVMATIRSFATVGVPPAIMGIGPAKAIPEALKRAQLSTEDIDVYEINEAFGSQFAYCLRELHLNEGELAERVNPKGGAIALGHPIGCTGARLVVTLLHELEERPDSAFGVVSMCTGSGMGAAAVFERDANSAKAEQK